MHNAIPLSLAANPATTSRIPLGRSQARVSASDAGSFRPNYPRHLSSFPLFGIEAHGFWTAKEDVEPRFFVLASYAAGEDPGEVVRRYMQSTEFAEDIRNFDVSDIVGVESIILIPSTSSPLK